MIKVLAYILLAYCLYQFYIIFSNGKQTVHSKYANDLSASGLFGNEDVSGIKNIDNNIVIEPSMKNANVEVKNPVRVVYNSVPGYVTLNVYPKSENDNLKYKTVISDYNTKSYAKLIRPDADVENKLPLILKFFDFNKVIFNKDEKTGTVSTKLDKLDQINNIYVQFYPDNEWSTKGEYKVLVAYLDYNEPGYKVNVDPYYRGTFKLGENEREILINLPQPINIIPGKTVALGFRKINSNQINISEILFNFEGDFDKIKNIIMSREVTQAPVKPATTFKQTAPSTFIMPYNS